MQQKMSKSILNEIICLFCYTIGENKIRRKNMTTKITKQNFSNFINNNDTVLIDFYAEWCGPCRSLGPVLDEISDENPNLIIGKINVDDEMELASQFHVRSIPTMIIFKDGNEVERLIGFLPKDEILKKLI